MEGQSTTWKPKTEFSKSRNPLEMVLSPLETPNVTDPWESFLTPPHTVSRDNWFCFYYKVWFGWAAEFISIKYRGLVLTLRQCWNDFDFINLFCRKVSQCASAGQCRAHSLSSCSISHTNKFEVRSAIESLFAKNLLNFHSVLTSLHLVFSEWIMPIILLLSHPSNCWLTGVQLSWQETLLIKYHQREFNR